MDEERLRLMEDAFIDGFRSAPDKLAFLLLAQVPLELDREGLQGLKLVAVKLDEHWAVGSAQPGFGSRELVYQPLPGAMATRTTRLAFVYLSPTGPHELPFDDIMGPSAAP